MQTEVVALGALRLEAAGRRRDEARIVAGERRDEDVVVCLAPRECGG